MIFRSLLAYLRPAVRAAGLFLHDIMPETIPMQRDAAPDGGPLTADVHPDEVAGFVADGWRVAESDAAQKPTGGPVSVGRVAERDDPGLLVPAPPRGRKRKP